MTRAEVGFKCDFCGKLGLVVSNAGIMYCQWCRKSYGEQLNIKGKGVWSKKLEDVQIADCR